MIVCEEEYVKRINNLGSNAGITLHKNVIKIKQ